MLSRFTRAVVWCSILTTLCAGVEARGQATSALYVYDLQTEQLALITAEPVAGYANCGASAWSPDGKRFVFDATPDTTWNKTRLFVADFPTRDRAAFTDLGPGNCPTWSMDATRITFLLNNNAVAGAPAGIWTMAADGADRQHLAGSGRPLWSPDGKRILTVSFDNPCTLTLVDIETRRMDPVDLRGPLFYSVPSWAGDGKTIVSVIGDDRPRSIALVELSDVGAAVVKQILWTRGDGATVSPACPVYSRELKRCVFSGWDPRGSALYAFGVGADKPRKLEKDLLDPKLSGLALSPNGRYVLFTSNRK